MSRPRTPTAILKRRGSFEAHPERARERQDEPQPKGKAVRPKFVKGAAARIWERYAVELEALGLLHLISERSFGRYCCLQAEFEKSPENFNANRLAQLHKAEEGFGLNPRAMASLHTSPEKQKDDDDRFFAAAPQTPNVKVQ